MLWSILTIVLFKIVAVLYLEPDWSILDLLNAASQRLELVQAAKRVFNADGKRVEYYLLNYLLQR